MTGFGKVYGYIAVLSDSRPVEDRVAALQALNIEKSRIVVEQVEKRRGKKAVRPQLQRLIERLKPGDTLTVESIDSLGLSFADILDSMELLSERQGVLLDILDMPAMSGRSADDPLRPFISALVIQSFLYMGQHQKGSRVIRQRQGIHNAQEHGVKFGRPAANVTPDKFREIASQWQTGGITSKAAAEALGFSRSTFFRRAKEAGFNFEGYKRAQTTGADGADAGSTA